MSDTERDPRINDLIGYAVNKNPVEFQNTFNDLVTDRLAQAVASRKDEVAQRTFGDPEETEPDEPDTPDAEPEEDSEEEEELDGEDS
jgi:hypothetical protein